MFNVFKFSLIYISHLSHLKMPYFSFSHLQFCHKIQIIFDMRFHFLNIHLQLRHINIYRILSVALSLTMALFFYFYESRALLFFLLFRSYFTLFLPLRINSKFPITANCYHRDLAGQTEHGRVPTPSQSISCAQREWYAVRQQRRCLRSSSRILSFVAFNNSI